MEGKNTETVNMEASPATPLPKLPDDIIVFDILSRLPAESLLRFRAVSKSWCSVISSDTRFIRTQLSFTKKYPDRVKLMVSYMNAKDHVDLLDCNIPRHVRREFPMKGSSWQYQILCSFDGLVLLGANHRPFMSPTKNKGRTLILWNPTVGNHTKFNCPLTFFERALYGICYDASVDGYKVVTVWESIGLFVAVYDVKSSSWSMSVKQSSFGIHNESGILVNGALHWIMARRNGSDHRLGIVYLDLVEDSFKELPLPDHLSNVSKLHMMVSDERLFIYACMDGETDEIWAMEEYGKKESWAKLIAFPCIIRLRTDIRSFKPLCLTSKMEVVMELDQRELVIYDPQIDQRKHPPE